MQLVRNNVAEVDMHVPDGFLDVPTSLAAGAVAVAGLGVCVSRAKRELDDSLAPLAGLTAAFVFAAQMINFPVGFGTSGHLIGGTLAAVLVGPAAGAIVLAVVLLVQAMFADGGLTALGANVVLLGFVATFGGYAVYRTLLRVLPQRLSSLPLAAGVAAGLSVPLAAAAFVVLFAFGATVSLPLANVLTAMVGIHLLIGIGEGVLTALTVAAVVRTRPDLVHAARLLPAEPLALKVA